VFFRIVTNFYLEKGKIIIIEKKNLKPSSFLAFIPSLPPKSTSYYKHFCFTGSEVGM